MEDAETLHIGPAVTKARGEQGSCGLCGWLGLQTKSRTAGRIGRAAAGLQAIGQNAFTLFSCLKGLKSVLTHFILSRGGTS